METLAELKHAAELKQKESVDLSQAYSATLSALFPANLILVVGAALLSLIAGASILIDNNLMTKTTSGILALVSSAFTIIHSKLECEQYQAECKKLQGFYRGIAEDYSNLQFIADPDELRKRFFALNDQRAATTKNTSSWPFKWATPNSQRDSAA